MYADTHRIKVLSFIRGIVFTGVKEENETAHFVVQWLSATFPARGLFAFPVRFACGCFCLAETELAEGELHQS